MNINRIIISGNLVADPTLRETNSGTPVASATIANNEFFNDGDGERQQVTTFAEVTVWGKSGESFASLAKKGQEVIIEDQLRRSDWESSETPLAERMNRVVSRLASNLRIWPVTAGCER
jgi:single-strand DNA-binding protein